MLTLTSYTPLNALTLASNHEIGLKLRESLSHKNSRGNNTTVSKLNRKICIIGPCG
jgi:hypothetical protein